MKAAEQKQWNRNRDEVVLTTLLRAGMLTGASLVAIITNLLFQSKKRGVRSKIRGVHVIFVLVLLIGINGANAETCDSWLGSSYCSSLTDVWGDTWCLGIKPYDAEVGQPVYADYYVKNGGCHLDEIAVDTNGDCDWDTLATDPKFEWSRLDPPLCVGYSLSGKINLGSFSTSGKKEIKIYGFSTKGTSNKPEVYRRTYVDISSVPDPSPEIYQVLAPTQIYSDQKATITVKAKNNGGASNEGYISVSFPNDEPISEISGTGNDYNKLYPIGHYPIYKCSSETMTAEDPLVELLDTSWSGGGHQESISMTVTPNGVGKIVFYVRIALLNSHGTYIRAPTSSSYTDQQECYVKKYEINVVCPGDSDHPSPSVSTSFDTNPSVVAPNEKYWISATIANNDESTSSDVGITFQLDNAKIIAVKDSSGNTKTSSSGTLPLGDDTSLMAFNDLNFYPGEGSGHQRSNFNGAKYFEFFSGGLDNGNSRTYHFQIEVTRASGSSVSIKHNGYMMDSDSQIVGRNGNCVNYVVHDPGGTPHDDSEKLKDFDYDSKVVNIISKPSVTILSITTSDTTPDPDETITLSVSTRNDGGAGTADIGMTVVDPSGDECNLQWKESVSYSAGQSMAHDFSYTVPSEVGYYRVISKSWDNCDGDCGGGQCCNPDTSSCTEMQKELAKADVFEVKLCRAEISDFRPPTGSYAPGSSAHAEVDVKNTGSESKTFWIGLSYRYHGSTSDSDWIEVEPCSTNTISPGSTKTVNFDFTLIDTADAYDIITKIWDGYDGTSMISPMYDEETVPNAFTIAPVKGYGTWIYGKESSYVTAISDYNSISPTNNKIKYLFCRVGGLDLSSQQVDGYDTSVTSFYETNLPDCKIYPMLDASGNLGALTPDELDTFAQNIADKINVDSNADGIHLDIEPYDDKLVDLVDRLNEKTSKPVTVAIGTAASPKQELFTSASIVVLMNYDNNTNPSVYEVFAKQHANDFLDVATSAGGYGMIGLPAIATHHEYKHRINKNDGREEQSGHIMIDYLVPGINGVNDAVTNNGDEHYIGISVWSLINEPIGLYDDGDWKYYPYEITDNEWRLLEGANAKITSWSVASGTFGPGDTVEATITVENTGDVDHTFYVGYSVKNPDGVYLDAPHTSVNLPAGTSKTVTLDWTVPDGAIEGSYGAIVSIWMSEFETSLGWLHGRLESEDKTDVFTVTTSDPDLSVTDVTFSDLPAETKPLTITATVRNNKDHDVSNVCVTFLNGTNIIDLGVIDHIRAHSSDSVSITWENPKKSFEPIYPNYYTNSIGATTGGSSYYTEIMIADAHETGYTISHIAPLDHSIIGVPDSQFGQLIIFDSKYRYLGTREIEPFGKFLTVVDELSTAAAIYACTIGVQLSAVTSGVSLTLCAGNVLVASTTTIAANSLNYMAENWPEQFDFSSNVEPGPDGNIHILCVVSLDTVTGDGGEITSDKYNFDYYYKDGTGDWCHYYHTKEYITSQSLSQTSAILKCPANLHAYDSHGRHVGVNALGEIDLEVPGAYYTGPDHDPEELIILGNSDNITYKIEALNEGEFNFTITQSTEIEFTTVVYSNVPIAETTNITIDVNSSNPSFTMELDSDGIIETREPDSIEMIEILCPNITSFAPPSPVTDTVGASRTFNITINQTADVSWLINGTEVQINESVTEASYTNTSAAVGIWNVSAIATNPNGTDMQTWVWNVVETPDITLTITSPAPDTTTHSPTITITGTASDPSGIASVTVNGVLADGAADWSTWSAEVALAVGENVITVVATNNTGGSRTEIVNVTYASELIYNGDFEILDPLDSSNPDGWTLEVGGRNYQGNSLYKGVESEYYYSGSHSIKFDLDGYSTECAYGIIKSPLIATVQGKLYWYQYQYTAADSSDIEYTIEFYDENNNLVSSSLYYTDTTTSNWDYNDDNYRGPDNDMSPPAVSVTGGGPTYGNGSWYEFCKDIPNIGTDKFYFEISIYQWEAPNNAGDGDVWGSLYYGGFDNFCLDPISPSFSITNAAAQPLDTTTTRITIDNMTNFGAATVTLSYDPTIVQINSITAGDVGTPIANIDNTAGTATITACVSTAIGPDSPITFANVELLAVGSDGETSPLTLAITTLSDADGNSVDATPMSGVFVVGTGTQFLINTTVATAADIVVSGTFDHSVTGSISLTPVADPEETVGSYFTGNDVALLGIIVTPDAAVLAELANGNDTIRIEVCYNATELAGKNIKSSTLELYRYDGADWVKMIAGTDPCVANGRDGTCVWIEVNNLSTFALVGTGGSTGAITITVIGDPVNSTDVGGNDTNLGLCPGVNQVITGVVVDADQSVIDALRAANGTSWVQIRIEYDQSVINSLGIDESTLNIWKYNKTTYGWELVKDQPYCIDNGRNTADNYVWVNVTELSTFALVGATASGGGGDLNSDGALTPADAAIALQIAAGSRPFDDAADVSGDGKITSLDALMIMQAAAGRIDL